MSKSLLNFMVSNIYKRGEDKIPENYYTDEKLSSIDSNYGRIKEIRGMPINDATLKKMVPILKKYSSNQIYKMIQRTAECKIKIFYPIRCFDDGSYTNIKNEIYSFSSSFFRLTEVKPIKYSKDKKILARSYTLIFDNILSYFYVHNVLACYIDILPGRFYSLSDNAQLFYRLLVLPYFKQVKNPIGLKEIKNRLVLKTSNTTMVRKTIKRIMDELDANSFIKAPKEIKKEGEYYYEYVKLKWDEIKK